MNIDLGNWDITLTIYKRFSHSNSIFKKYTVVGGKTPFFVISPFSSHHSICLNNGFWQGSFASTFYAFSSSNFNKKNGTSVFEKKFIVFQKANFKIESLILFKIFSYYHIKICQSLKRKAILKSSSAIF